MVYVIYDNQFIKMAVVSEIYDNIVLGVFITDTVDKSEMYSNPTCQIRANCLTSHAQHVRVKVQRDKVVQGVVRHLGVCQLLVQARNDRLVVPGG